MTTGRINQGAIHRSARRRERLSSLYATATHCANGLGFENAPIHTLWALFNFSTSLRFAFGLRGQCVHCVSREKSDRTSFKFTFFVRLGVLLESVQSATKKCEIVATANRRERVPYSTFWREVFLYIACKVLVSVLVCLTRRNPEVSPRRNLRQRQARGFRID